MASTNRDEISRLELLHAAHPDGLVFPHLADAYRRAGRYAQAESVLNAGLRRHEDYSSAHVVLGRLRLDQGKRREAETAFQRVLQLDPNNHVALEYLGRLTAEEGRTDEALGYLRRLAAIKPSDELAGQIAGLERQAREARDAPQRAAVEPWEEDGAHRTEDPGPSSRGSNGADRAESDRTRPAAPTLPEPGEVVTETMAELYARQGLHERAEAVYRQLSDRDPGNARLRQKLAEAVARRRGDPAVEENPTAASPTKGTAPGTAPPRATGVSPPFVPTPETRTDGPSIQSYLSGVLDWTPGASGPDAGEEAGAAAGPSPAEPDGDVWEPWASAPVSEPAPPTAPQSSSRPQSATRPELSTRPEPPPAVPPAPDVPPSSPEPEPWAATPITDSDPWEAAPAREAEPWSAAPISEPSGPPEAAGAAPGPEPAPAPRPEPEAKRTPSYRPGPTPGELGLTEDDLEGADARSRALVALTDMLVGLLEYRDPFFRGSSSLTRLVATNVADEMGLDASDRVNLALAAVLRDLGRLAMGGRLVESQKGSKTKETRRKIERHIDLALHLMEGIELPRSVMLAVRHHHERWDGAGYPDGLAGEQIPRLARVLAAVDSFAAMVSPRPYRLPRKVPDAAREMEEAAGTQYDPQVVAALLRVLDRRDQPHLGFVQRHHILLVNPDQPGAVVTAAKLCTNGYLAEVAVDPDAARERLRRVPVAALVVSAEAGADAAEEFIRDLRLDPLFASIPIVAVDAESVGLRVRLLESGADVCFPPGISYGELQGTLGALVRRTLRSRETRSDSGDEEAPWLALQGDVQDFPLAWLLQVMKYDSRTAGVGIRTATGQGAIYIVNGDAVHAQIRGGAKGEGALKTMLQWTKGRFTVQPDARPKERSIESSIMHLLLTQAVEEDHAAAGIFGAVSDHG